MFNFCRFLGGHFENEGATFPGDFFEQKRCIKYTDCAYQFSCHFVKLFPSKWRMKVLLNSKNA